MHMREEAIESRERILARLSAPRLRPDRVRRSRLMELLERGAAGRMLILEAPAGFGKTTLVADWLASTRRAHAWLSVEEEGPDALLCRLQTAVELGLGLPGTDAAFRSSDAALVSIASMIADSASPFALVLDDYHNAEDGRVHEAVMRLARLLPEGVCLVIASRTGLPFPAARFMVRGELEAIGTEELRFTLAEAREFLSRAVLPRLSDEDVALLEVKTEGWIAGLQLAALALRDGRDSRTFIEAFRGSSRRVFDFLAEEALSALPADILDFLCATSVVESFCAPLCEALSGRKGAAALLALLEHECLFLAPLDEDRRWYRLHNLFREALLARLRATSPGEEPRLRLAASAWLEANGLPAEALRQAALAGDAERAASLAEGYALAALERGEIGEIRAALAALPEAAGGPWLNTAAAWAAAYAGDLSGAAERGDAALSAASRGLPPAAETRLRGHVEAVRAYSAWLSAEASAASEGAMRALRILPDGDLMARCHAEMTYGASSYMLGADAEAAKAFRSAMDLSLKAGIRHVRYFSAASLAGQMVALGDLDGAKAFCLSLAGEAGAAEQPAFGNVLVALSQVHWERNETDEALEAARRGLDLCLRWGHADSLVMAYIALAAAQAAVRDFEAALALISRARRLESISVWHKLNLDEAAASIELERGNRKGAEAFCARPQPIGTYEGNFTLCAYLIATKRASEALPILATCRESCEKRGLSTRTVETYVLLALARRARGEKGAALEALAAAVAEASPKGLARRFLRRGPPLLELLEEYTRGGNSRDPFVERLFSASREGEGGRKDRVEGPLSPREIEILRLIVEGRTAEEVAEILCVAPSTVRSHIKSVYAKLGVHRRIEALRRARELGLL
jgi:LuxR family maltose regulon positive regulatory protein